LGCWDCRRNRFKSLPNMRRYLAPTKRSLVHLRKAKGTELFRRGRSIDRRNQAGTKSASRNIACETKSDGTLLSIAFLRGEEEKLRGAGWISSKGRLEDCEGGRRGRSCGRGGRGWGGVGDRKAGPVPEKATRAATWQRTGNINPKDCEYVVKREKRVRRSANCSGAVRTWGAGSRGWAWGIKWAGYRGEGKDEGWI